MKIPAEIKHLTPLQDENDTYLPALGMLPVAEGNDNGDLFGLYWPIGRESFDPIVAHFWHDDEP